MFEMNPELVPSMNLMVLKCIRIYPIKIQNMFGNNSANIGIIRVFWDKIKSL